jgi:hypothetical protein
MDPQCERCGEFKDCQTFTVHTISLCKSCIEPIVAEWKIGNRPRASGPRTIQILDSFMYAPHAAFR